MRLTNAVVSLLPADAADSLQKAICDSEALLRSADRILVFIEYFNRTLAKPFEWKYEGYPQVV